jgi:hypothetical protein
LIRGVLVTDFIIAEFGEIRSDRKCAKFPLFFGAKLQQILTAINDTEFNAYTCYHKKIYRLSQGRISCTKQIFRKT